MSGQQPAEAKVLQFPVETRSCFDCIHAAVGLQGTYCHVFGEMILSEVLAASDCSQWEVET